LEEHGAVIVREVLDADTLSRLNAEIAPAVEATRPDRKYINAALDFFYGTCTRNVTGMAAKSRIFATDVLCHPLLLGVCDAILGPSCARYQMNVAQVLDRGPGADGQMLHRDEAVWVHMPRPHPQLQVVSVIALVDFTEDNGATRIVPGSHAWPLERQPEPDEIATAVMPAGSAVLYLGSTIHGGGPNTTASAWRRGMHLSYVLGWLRTEENHYLGTPLEVVRSLPRQAQELLGYAAHDAIEDGGGYLGAVDLSDPVELLADGRL
jgi:ectoine hydroxylase-related dioxygenase (phytanoyl-CoA dioxygenase family)